MPTHAAVAMLVTHGFRTRDAKAWGDKYGVYGVNREALRRQVTDRTALPDLPHLPLRGRGRARLKAA